MVLIEGQWRSLARKVTPASLGLAESNGSLPPGWLKKSPTSSTPESAPGPSLGHEYGKTLPFYFIFYHRLLRVTTFLISTMRCAVSLQQLSWSFEATIDTTASDITLSLFWSQFQQPDVKRKWLIGSSCSRPVYVCDTTQRGWAGRD